MVEEIQYCDNGSEVVSPIVVEVSGGVVQDVANIPAGISVHVHDYDTDGQDEETIKVDNSGGKYFLEKW